MSHTLRNGCTLQKVGPWGAAGLLYSGSLTGTGYVVLSQALVRPWFQVPGIAYRLVPGTIAYRCRRYQVTGILTIK